MGHAPFGERKWRAFTKWLTTEHFLLPSPYSSRSAQQTKSLFQSRVLCFPKCRRAKSFSVKIVVPCSLVCFTWITGLTVSACGVFGVFLFPSLCFLNAACTVLKRAHFHAALARVVCECDSKPIRSTELEQRAATRPQHHHLNLRESPEAAKLRALFICWSAVWLCWMSGVSVSALSMKPGHGSVLCVC